MYLSCSLIQMCTEQPRCPRLYISSHIHKGYTGCSQTHGIFDRWEVIGNFLRREWDTFNVVFGQHFAESPISCLHIHSPMKMEQTQCSEMSIIKHHTPGNNPKDYTQHLEHGESLKSRILPNSDTINVQTGPGAHPASCTMGTGSFLGVESSRGMTLTPHPSRSKNRVVLYLYSL
jgi:hypothetical protein